jgi:hypothetical protein
MAETEGMIQILCFLDSFFHGELVVHGVARFDIDLAENRPPATKLRSGSVAIQEGRAQVRSANPATQFRYRHVDGFVRSWWP